MSLRFLPRDFREPTSVAYLLARASDTIADAGDLPVEERKLGLAAFCRWLGEGGEFEIPKLSGLPPGEVVLMEALEDCREALLQLPGWQQKLVKQVVEIITEGQSWDLSRFQGPGVVGLESDEELRTYTYQVAGCVGEFWTEMGFGVDPQFALRESSEMRSLGQAYGRALQLINILRDVPEDLENGRCYLPRANSQEELLGERRRWIEEAHAGLDQAQQYAEALTGKRMRFGTILPAMIGRETLARLEKATWDEWTAGVKISRSEVYGMMARAMKFAL